MKKHLKTTQPVSSLFEKPAKDRILESSDTLFRTYGIRTSLKAIAHHANSNVETVVKYYGFHERLVSLFVKSLIQQAEQYWDELEQQHLNDAEGSPAVLGVLPAGANRRSLRSGSAAGPSAAELSGGYPKDPLLVEIEQYWQAERRRLVRLCRAANFREPGELADKLLLLVHGLRNERGAFGHYAPSRLLPKAADDLMVAHGAIRKPLLSWNCDED